LVTVHADVVEESSIDLVTKFGKGEYKNVGHDYYCRVVHANYGFVSW